MPTFAKLNLKDQTEIVVLNAPASFEPELKALKGVTIRRDAKGGDIDFSLAFVMTQKEVDALGPQVAKKAKGDAVVWFAYPKGSSKKYKSQINRDSGWTPRSCATCVSPPAGYSNQRSAARASSRRSRTASATSPR